MSTLVFRPGDANVKLLEMANYLRVNHNVKASNNETAKNIAAQIIQKKQ
ncbi:MAG: hypothetical protein PUC50_00170 [Bacteroidales bacterium]|nr:hypothetical protein [Bacteroidales bacterium]